MPSAEQVATALAYEFLKKGNYSAASGPVEVPRLLRVAAVADVLEDEGEFQIIPEFAGLSVQSVGFEDGVDDPKVHIYLTRGSSRMIKELPEEVEDVPLRAQNRDLSMCARIRPPSRRTGVISMRKMRASVAAVRVLRLPRICQGL